MISHIGKWLLVSFFILVLSGCVRENHDWIVSVEGGESCAAYALWGFAHADGSEKSRFEDEVILSFPFSSRFVSPKNIVVSILVVGLCANPGLELLKEFDNSVPEEVREKVESLDYLNESGEVVFVKIFQDGVLVHSGEANFLFDFFRVF